MIITNANVKVPVGTSPKSVKPNENEAISKKPDTDTLTISKGAGEAKNTGEANEADNEKLVAQLLSDSEQRTIDFQNLLRTMFTKQSDQHSTAFNPTSADRAMAQASIEPGGMHSVEAVSGRIMDMAKALAGDDTSKISILRDAVQKGFEAAGMTLGRELPQVSKDTYDEVMKQFDEWENGGKTETTE